VKHLSKALLLALLVGVPAIAETRTWEHNRDIFLGAFRSTLMEDCAIGRKMNTADTSYWDPKIVEQHRQAVRKAALSGGPTETSLYEQLEAIRSGQAAAMAIACPTVW